MAAERSVVPSAEPNLTPMIDVLLVMIIVFMVAVMRVTHTMDVQLPDVCAGSCNSGDAIVLEVLPGPSYRINQQSVAGNQLTQALSAVYAGRPDKTLQVAGSPSVRYEEVIQAMDAAKGSGVRVLAISPKGAR